MAITKKCGVEISVFGYVARLGRGARNTSEITYEEMRAGSGRCEQAAEFRVIIGGPAYRETTRAMCAKHAYTRATAYAPEIYTAIVG